MTHHNILANLTVVLCFVACTAEFDSELAVQQSSYEAEDARTRSMTEGEKLIFTQGVGYSYNGLYGEYCNSADVRCQVIDLDSLRKYDNSNMFRDIYDVGESYDFNDGFSPTEYVHNTYVKASAEGDVAIVFAGSVQADFNIWQHARTNSYFCRSVATKGMKTCFISEEDLITVIKNSNYGERLLTRNFREALARLKKQLENPSQDKRRLAIDSLIARYGTHVVTSATIGGSIELEMRIETDTLNTLYQKELMANMTLAMFKNREFSDEEQRALQVLNSADCRLTVRGGNLALLDSNIFGFKWGENKLKNTDITKWMESVNDNTAVMTAMRMIPIWEVIPDDDLAKRVEAHITGQSELLTELFGYQNFVSTKFPAHPQQNKGGYGCNIMAAGRYVAAVFCERINAISMDEEVWVAYPIYNQQLNLASGLCIHNGKAYRVGWRYNDIYVEELKTAVPPDGNIYMNAGLLQPVSRKGLTYLTNTPVVAYEWPSAIRTDGSVNTDTPWYYVYKRANNFFLRNRNGQEQNGELHGLPNWSYSTTWMRMLRNTEYYYYYNPKEVEKL